MSDIQSRCFSMDKLAPMDKSLTPALAHIFNAYLPDFLFWSSSHLFTNDFASTICDQSGIKYPEECFDVQVRLELIGRHRDYYCLFLIDFINFNKTEGL